MIIKSILPVRKFQSYELSLLAKAVSMSLLGLSVSSQLAHAGNIEVTSHLDDNGAGCTFREALISVNNNDLRPGCFNFGSALGNNDSITFSNNLSSTIIVATSSADTGSRVAFEEVMSDVVIDASSISGGIVLNGDGFGDVLRFTSDATSIEVELNNLTITGGGLENLSAEPTPDTLKGTGRGLFLENSNVTINNSSIVENNSNNHGGGIYIADSSVTIQNSSISKNSIDSSGRGVGIYSIGSTLNIESSVLSENVGGSGTSGGAIYSKGAAYDINTSHLSILETSITGNTAVRGGGVYTQYSTVSVDRSTISGNTASGAGGGGFYITFGDLDIQNSTISGNASSFGGGGINARGGFVDNTVTLDISNVTIAKNSALYFEGEGIQIENTTLNLSNSIISDSVVNGVDCRAINTNYSSSFVNIDSSSIIEDGNCGALRPGDPELLPLADNGGVTFTHALGPNSQAIDSGTDCEAEDQRGVIRDQSCDIGAFEIGDINQEVDESFKVIPLKNGKVIVVPL